MAYNEHIYIQKMSGGEAVDITEIWGFYGKELPFVMYNDIKEPYKNDWLDEDGDDEYIPDVLPYKSYDMTLELCRKSNDRNSTNGDLKDLINFLTGHDGTGASFMLYCTYTGIGRKDVRFVGLSDDAELIRQPDYDLLFIKIKVKVNDPVTEIIYDEENNILKER